MALNAIFQGNINPMRKKLTILIVFILPTLLACQVFSNLPAKTPSLSDVQTIVAATRTALASQTPPTPVATAVPLDQEVVGEGVPSPVSPLTLVEGAQTILLMGSDQRPNDGGFRTDTLVLLIIKTDGTLTMVSVPRDLWVYLPGKGMYRINAAMEYGGFDMVKATFEYNFGFAPQSYVLTNFSGFKTIVDSLGGINVQVGAALWDERDGYPGGFTIDPGLVYMDGDLALWYVRSRKSTSDLDRLRRSQEVLIAIGQKLFSLDGLARLPEFYSAFRGTVTTDLTLGDATALLPLLQSVDQNNVQRFTFSDNEVTPFTNSQGMYVLLPRRAAIRQLLNQALGQ